MADKDKSRSKCLICLLWLCCVLLTMATFTFSMYTVKEMSMMKARINELESHLNPVQENMGSSNQDYMEIIPQKISRTRTKKRKKTIFGRLKTKSLCGNRSNVFIHLIGGRNDKGANATDRNVIKHWMVSHSTDNVTYNADKGFIQVTVPGYYYIYSQIQVIFKKWENEIRRHETLINSKRVLLGMFGYRGKHEPKGVNFDANYQGGVFELRNGDRVFIRGNNRRGPPQKEANYFGVFLLAATPL